MFSWITRVITQFGYTGVVLLTFLENLFPPIPSELIIPLAGFVAANGELQLWAVIAAGSAGTLAGAWLWYEVGRSVGERRLRQWIARHGKWLTLGPTEIDRSQDWFRRHGGAAVFFGRLVPGIRTFVSVPAGFAGMPRLPFLLYSAAGTVAWTAALALSGVVLQGNFRRVESYADVVTNVIFAALGAALLRRYIRCWRG
jgi:membrane protein DedA with SNARE-associated domain